MLKATGGGGSLGSCLYAQNLFVVKKTPSEMFEIN